MTPQITIATLEVLTELKLLIKDVRKLIGQFIEDVEDDNQCECNHEHGECSHCTIKRS